MPTTRQRCPEQAGRTLVGFDTSTAVTAQVRPTAFERRGCWLRNSTGPAEPTESGSSSRPPLGRNSFRAGAHLSTAQCAVKRGHHAGQRTWRPWLRRRADGAIPLCDELARLCRAYIHRAVAFVIQASRRSSGLPRSGHISGLRRPQAGKHCTPQSRQPASKTGGQAQRLACSRLLRTLAGRDRKSAVGPARSKAMRRLLLLFLAEFLNP